jgi:pyruvate/2-oxoglutarate dehydrogenase complex dihydrolipoamide acyltransferase (E2) component
MTKVVLPKLGEGVEKATVSFWYFKVGDKVKEQDDLVEFATDKATFNLPSPVSGTLSEILIPEGSVANVGAVLGVIE